MTDTERPDDDGTPPRSRDRSRFKWTDLGKARAYAAQQFQRETAAARRRLATARKAIKNAKASDDTDPHNRCNVLRLKAMAVGFMVMGGGLEWEVGFNGLREIALKWPDRDPKKESDEKIDQMISFAFMEADRAVLDPKRNQARPPTADLDDFAAYLPDHTFICRKTRAFWTMAGVNAAFPGEVIPASEQIERGEPVHCMSWMPGDGEIVRNTVVMKGGKVVAEGYHTYNLYLPPTLAPVAGDAAPWLDHVKRIYPDDWQPIVDCLAFKVQHPGEKINHALVLGGGPGVGKDTLLEPVRRAVGDWNFAEASPNRILDSQYNGYRQSVIVRISEAKDLGEYKRYDLSETLKTLIAAPPDTLEVNDKYDRMIYLPNVTLVILTTNHRHGALHLTRDDRRYGVYWSEAKKEDFDADYWDKIWGWYENENGCAIVADFLLKRDLSRFNPKAAPKLTPAFWTMVDAEVSRETTELADVIDRLGVMQNGEVERPKAVTIEMVISEVIKNGVMTDFASWLHERKNGRRIPHLFTDCGYVAFRNEANKREGMWKIGGKRQVVYVQRELSKREAHDAVQALIEKTPSATVTDLEQKRREREEAQRQEARRQSQTKNDGSERNSQDEDDDVPF